MDNRPPFIDRRQRGAVSPVTLAVIGIVVALAVAAWFLIVKPYRDARAAETPAPVAVQKAAATGVAPPANVDALSVDQLLAEARTAMNEQRLVAPAGNNAFEFYMKVLQKQPGNPVAADALRETFSYGSAATEQTINQRDFNEAQREIDLLAKADPENYTLTILRSKLDAQRKTLDREQQQAVDAQKAQQVAQQNAAATQRQQAEQAAAAIEAQRAQAAREQAARVAQAQQAVPVAAPVARPAAAPAASEGGAISDAVLIRQVNPRYPTAAMRANQEGWVDVELTVGPDGRVANVNVVDAQPKHIFDRSAIDAVSRWEYKAATRNGEPMTVTLRRRLQFNLGR
ncbi:MAG: energy transducer TonB [Luteibacter sp.]|uniref:energy transducer TonB n=1 Tax=Luteibacter TaxID=242605 RepID=UPI00055FFD38|nr:MULTISPECIES: energy transducer TonB [unclassified Luteibacter]MDQ7996457.1 energy transducer TonB [Luteibacter sp.]MDQ8047915.1 energy transducer TonB [Luteibacter sp.]MDR6642649.1 protein TonB [Luteibacter sp. 1214]